MSSQGGSDLPPPELLGYKKPGADRCGLCRLPNPPVAVINLSVAPRAGEGHNIKLIVVSVCDGCAQRVRGLMAALLRECAGGVDISGSQRAGRGRCGLCAPARALRPVVAVTNMSVTPLEQCSATAAVIIFASCAPCSARGKGLVGQLIREANSGLG